MNRDTHEMLDRVQRLGVSMDDAYALRRISMTLQRWFELECGNEHGFCVERDEEHSYTCSQCGHKGYGEQSLTCNCEKCGDVAPIRRKASGKCYMRNYDRDSKPWRVADRETGARKRLAAIMAKYPTLTAYVQTDPRGASLYILTERDLEGGHTIDSIYSRGVAVYK